MNDDKYRLKAHEIFIAWRKLCSHYISFQEEERLVDAIREALAESAREAMDRAAKIAEGWGHGTTIAEAIRKGGHD
jgi:hypothetical protein